MLGQHPQLYGVPELNLFIADTIEGWFKVHTHQLKRPQGTHGLVRTLAQLHESEQTEEGIQRAWEWLAQRRDWATDRLWGYLEGLVAPRIIVEKSPMTVMKLEFIERAYRFLPNAQFLHLTRHPVKTAKSLTEILDKAHLRGLGERKVLDPFDLWWRTHDSILDFSSVLPTGQSIRLKGEWLLEEPARYIPQICQWLGLRDDESAIDATLHPEHSPYARIGPPNAPLGNDNKFLSSPELRPVRFDDPKIDDDPVIASLAPKLRKKVRAMAAELDYVE
jgi:hypothetical protein